ncbi:MAG: cell division protein FtsA [Anaerovoracaceae bacterium]
MNRKDIAKYKDDLIFSLDIGTRSVVGVLGVMIDTVFTVLDFEQRFHEIRAMRDGQVEDIELVCKACTQVKKELENRNGIKLKEVSIAAAGRALKTVRASHAQELADENTGMTLQQVRNLEYAAIAAAQEKFYQENGMSSSGNGFQCVGYSVLQYRIDGYPIRNLEGHKGQKAEADIIAAFLPFSVVKSLYAVTAGCGLEVRNLTLEPIAAISVIVPPDVRLLNIAIADVGAGTSDIAVSRNGSIVAYDMVTTAGDELTESIMNAYLTEFDVSETVKKSLAEDSDAPVEFEDILGFTHSYTRQEILEKIDPAIDSLADAISDSILRCNEGSPAAVFLIGGGSQIPGLCEKVAERLDMPANRVALGGTQKHRHVDVTFDELRSPEFVTPVGIGTVAAEYKGCDFFSITVNGKRIMLMHTGTIRALDALLLAGIRATSLIGRSSRGITYFVNGQKKRQRGTASVPGQVEINGQPASLESDVKQGDQLTVIPAKNGEDPKIRIADLDEIKESVGYDKKIVVNGQPADEDYIIRNMDEIQLLPADAVIEEARSLQEQTEKEQERIEA